MAGSTLGKILQITTWGESHGKGIGVVIDGCPAGLPLSEADIQPFLDRRKPGQSKFTTARSEADSVQILSGVFEGKTTGTPISLVVFNEDQHSKDYSNIANVYRPGHADFGFDEKYGFRDYRGGGRSSGRETIGRVAAGAVCAKLLSHFGIRFETYTAKIGPVNIRSEAFDYEEAFRNPLYMPDAEAAKEAQAYLETCIQNQDSSGGMIQGAVYGLPVGLGEPVFDKLDACLGKAMFSVGSVKGFEIGDGFSVCESLGSKNNDTFVAENGTIKKETNHSGGVLGGFSDGAPLTYRVAVKPTPSISQPQRTVNRNGENVTIEIKGRHDPIIVPRAVVVVEAMAAITIADLFLQNATSSLSKLEHIYKPIED